jgi:Transposase domain (DUF772)/Transposase DDE domain
MPGKGRARPDRRAELIYGYATGTVSSRKLEQATHRDVAVRMLVADQHPDYRSIARFRARHLEALAELFVQALRLCKKAGLVKMGALAIDGTKLRANASRHKAMSYERMGEAKAALEAEEAERERARQAQMRSEGREPRKPDPDDEPPTPKPTAQGNFTDPESKIMKTSDGAFHQCFNAQAVVDSHAQVIVTAELTDEAPDARQLAPALEQLDENLEAIGAELPEGAALLGDAGYFSEDNVATTAGHGLEPPPGDRPLQALRARVAGAARPGPQGRHPKAADGAQAADQARPHGLREAQDDRRAGLRADGDGAVGATIALARQNGGPSTVALSLRGPQPAEAAPGRRVGAGRGHVAGPGGHPAPQGGSAEPRNRLLGARRGDRRPRATRSAPVACDRCLRSR